MWCKSFQCLETHPGICRYPFEKGPLSPRFRGEHALRRYPNGEERCIGEAILTRVRLSPDLSQLVNSARRSAPHKPLQSRAKPVLTARGGQLDMVRVHWLCILRLDYPYRYRHDQGMKMEGDHNGYKADFAVLSAFTAASVKKLAPLTLLLRVRDSVHKNEYTSFLMPL